VSFFFLHPPGTAQNSSCGAGCFFRVTQAPALRGELSLFPLRADAQEDFLLFSCWRSASSFFVESVLPSADPKKKKCCFFFFSAGSP